MLSKGVNILLGRPVCSPCCQNETLLCIWSKLSSWYTYIHHIIHHIGGSNFEIRQSSVKLCSFDFQGMESVKWEMAFKKLRTIRIIKITPVSFKFWSKTFIVHLKHTNNYDFAQISKLGKNRPTGISVISLFEVLHRIISFW